MAKKPTAQALTDSTRVSVILAVPHVHAGQPRRKGETLTVSQSRADWMRRHGLIDPPQPDTLTAGEIS